MELKEWVLGAIILTCTKSSYYHYYFFEFWIIENKKIKNIFFK
jgi:hypothetical protein